MQERRHARILAMQALCQFDVLRDDFLPDLPAFLADENASDAARSYARGLAERAWADLARIDGLIQAAAENWSVPRMAPVDRNILRSAVCELLTRPDVPAKVVLDEAVEIAKQFGAAESPAFVNGVLDSVLKALPARDSIPHETLSTS